MIIDVLIAEIGSTTTIVNAFDINNEKPRFINRGVSNTTVETDVNIGLNKAIENLKNNMDVNELEYKEMFATSSAAGGLKMTVHGLVYEMTVKASKEAALNAGANIHLITSNVITDEHLEEIELIKPNIILVAGGTDYGERDTAIVNIKKILNLDLNVPVIYAGNIENHKKVQAIFKDKNKEKYLKIVDNVYPRVDYMNILPLRKVIYQTFEENIIHAKGMNNIFKMVNRNIMPTPGSVMESTMTFYEKLGNVITVDIGGATSDIHSVSVPSEEYEKYLEGEPLSKRTVEGDLGVYINYKNVIDLIGQDKIISDLKIQKNDLNKLIDNYKFIPITKEQRLFTDKLTEKCLTESLDRHVGDLQRVFTTNGQKIIPNGKDLTKVEYIILTGGALLNHNDPETIIKKYIENSTTKLLPSKDVIILKDHDYIMASIGVLSLVYPKQAFEIFKTSLRIGVDDNVA